MPRHFRIDKEVLRRSVWWCALIAAGLSQIYILPKVFDTSDGEYFANGHDFRLIWLAGDLWRSLENPYSDVFDLHYQKFFGRRPASHFWVYPPYWYPITTILSMASFKAALLIWNIIGWVCIILAAYCLALSMRLNSRHAVGSAFLILIALGSLIQATPFVLALGQTSLLIYLGCALVVLGYNRGSSLLVFFGLTLVILKPQIGAIFFAFAFINRWMLLPALFAIITSAIASSPAFLVIGFADTVSGFLSNISAYNSKVAVANVPAELVGLPKFLSIFGLDTGSAILLPAAIATILFARFLNLKGQHLLYLTIALALFLGGLHTYDLTLAISIAPFVGYSALRLWTSIGGFLFVFRPANLAAILPIQAIDASIFPGSVYATFGIFLLVVAVVVIKEKLPELEDSATRLG